MKWIANSHNLTKTTTILMAVLLTLMVVSTILMILNDLEVIHWLTQSDYLGFVGFLSLVMVIVFCIDLH